MNPSLQLNNQQASLRVFIEVEQGLNGRIRRVGAVLYDTANNKEMAVFDRTVAADDKQDFAQALAGLAVFCANYPVWTYDTGERLLKEECRRSSTVFPFARPFIRVRSLLSSWGVRSSRYSARNLYEAAGLKNDGAEGALHDARSVAGAVSFFENIELL